MNHKILLALFLCLVIIFSSSIVSLNEDKVVQVKKASSTIDTYTIGNINEENENVKINVFYPVTKYENVNLEIMNEIQKYITKVKESKYVSEDKFLKISFEDYENDGKICFKFNVEYNEGLYHNSKDEFTIEYIENET